MAVAIKELVPMTVREYFYPGHAYTSSCIVAPTAHAVNVFTIKLGNSYLLPHFHGMDHENPYRGFEDKVGTLCIKQHN